ncbi:uncharacterized protein NPIL_58831 [Nephila pilipes]|uniref:Chitin-binding type-2 domain-containing protein n=1 Tax=Nephila pilipes TaxID=299642 RepID=A0A8X6PQ03_NEPPI|nr:uncharacterized protein NPIL_58831 [Nephila pilipes]
MLRHSYVEVPLYSSFWPEIIYPAHRYSDNLYEAKFESSRTRSVSQSSAIDDRDSVRIGRRNDATSTEGSVRPTKKISFKRGYSGLVPFKPSEQQTNSSHHVVRNFRKRISRTDDQNLKKNDTDRVQKNVPKDIPKQDSSNTSAEIKVEGLNHDFTRIKQNYSRTPKKDFEKKDKKQSKHSYLKMPEGRATTAFKSSSDLPANEQVFTEVTSSNYASPRSNTNSEKIDTFQGFQNSEAVGRDQKSMYVENANGNSQDLKIDTSSSGKNKIKRKKVVRLRNPHKNSNTTKTMETKASQDNQTNGNDEIDIFLSLPPTPNSLENEKENNTNARDNSEIIFNDKIKTDLNTNVDESFDHMLNIKEEEIKYDLNVPSDEIVSHSTQKNAKEPSKADFSNSKGGAKEYGYEFPKEKLNFIVTPQPKTENNDEINDEYMLTFNYMGNKKDQPKDVIKLSDSISKKGLAKKAQVQHEKKFSFKKFEKLKPESHRIKNERTEHEESPRVEKMEFSKRFKALPENDDLIAIVNGDVEADITRNYDLDITTKTPITFKRKSTKKLDDSVWTPAKVEKYSSYKKSPKQNNRDKDFNMSNNKDTYFHSYNDRSSYHNKKNLHDKTASLTNDEKIGFTKKEAANDVLKPYNKMLPVKKQLVSPSDDEGKYFMHMFKRVGDVSLEHFSPQSGEMSRNDGFMSAIKLRWNDDDTRAQIESSIDSRMQPSSFEYKNDMFQNSYGDRLISEASAQREHTDKTNENADINRNFAEIGESKFEKHDRKFSRKKRSANSNDHYFQSHFTIGSEKPFKLDSEDFSNHFRHKETQRMPNESQIPRQEFLQSDRRQYESTVQKPNTRIDRRRSNFEDKPYYLKPDMKNFKNIPMKLKPQSRIEDRPTNPEIRSYYLKPEDATEIKKLKSDFHTKQLHFPFASYEKPTRESKTVELFQSLPPESSSPEQRSSQVDQRESAWPTPQNNNYKSFMASSHSKRFHVPSYRIPLETKPNQESKNIEQFQSFYKPKQVVNETPAFKTFPTDQIEMWNVRIVPKSNKNKVKTNSNSNVAFYSSQRPSSEIKPAQESKNIESFQSYFEIPKQAVNQTPELRNFYSKEKSEKRIQMPSLNSNNKEFLKSNYTSSLFRSPADMMFSKQKRIEENKTPEIRALSMDNTEMQNVQGLPRDNNDNKSLPKRNYNNYRTFLQKAPSEMKMSSVKLTQNPSEESNKNKMKSRQFGLRPKVFGKEKLLTNEKADSLNKSRFEARLNKPKQIGNHSKFQRRTEKFNLKTPRHPFLNDKTKTEENKNQSNGSRDLARIQTDAINLKQDQDLMKHSENVNLKRNQELLRQPENVDLKPNQELIKRPEHVELKPSQILMKRNSEKVNLNNNQELFKRSEKQHFHLPGDNDSPLTGARNNARNNARSIDPHAWEYGFEQPEVGVNFPGYSSIPKTNFQCKGKNGYYADPEAGCQVFHMCQGRGVKHSFLCPNNTIFNQHLLVCDWYNRVNCEGSVSRQRINDHIYNENSNLNNIRNNLPTHNEYENHQRPWVEQQARSNINYDNFRTTNIQRGDNKMTLNRPQVLILDKPRNYKYENHHAQRNINIQKSRIHPSNLNLNNLQDSSDVLKSSFSLPKSLTKVPNNIENISKNVKYKNIQKDKTLNKENIDLQNNFRSEKIINEQFIPDNETSPRGFHYFKENEYLVLHDNAKPENKYQIPVPKVFNNEEKVNVKNSWNSLKLQNLQMEPERILSEVDNITDIQSTMTSYTSERKPLSRPNFKPKETHFVARHNQQTIKPQTGESTITVEELEGEKQSSRYHQQKIINMDSNSKIVPFKNQDFSANFKLNSSKFLPDKSPSTTKEPKSTYTEVHSEKEQYDPFVETTTLLEEKESTEKGTTQKPFNTPNSDLIADSDLDGIKKDSRYKSSATLEQSSQDSKTPIYTYPLSPILRKTEETGTKKNFGDRIDKPKDENIQKKSNSPREEARSKMNIYTRNNQAPKINITSRIVDVISKIETIGTDVSKILDGKGNVYKNINIQKLKPTIPPKNILNINLNSFTSTKPLKKTGDSKLKESLLQPPIKTLPKVLKDINTDFSQINSKNAHLHKIHGKLNKSSEFTSESSADNSTAISKNESQKVSSSANEKQTEALTKTELHDKGNKIFEDEILQQRNRQHHNINEHVQSKKPVEIYTKRKYDRKSFPIFKPKQETVYTNMKPNGYVIKIGPLKRDEIKQLQNVKKEILNSSKDYAHSNHPQQNARANLFSFTSTTPKFEQIPTFTPQNILSTTISSKNIEQYNTKDKFQNSHLRSNPHLSLEIHPKRTNRLEHLNSDNRHNINEKYHDGTRNRHTYHDIPQRIPTSHSHNEKYSFTEIPHPTKASLPETNLPAFIFTVNPLPGHRTPDWKSGQNYNPGQQRRPNSVPPIQQKIEGKIQPFNQKVEVTMNNDDDDDCDDSLNPTENVESSSYFSLGKHGPNVHFPENKLKSGRTFINTRERTEKEFNNEKKSKDIKCKNLTGNKSEHNKSPIEQLILTNEPTTPIIQIKSHFKKGLADFKHLAHFPKSMHQSSYIVQTNSPVSKQNFPQKEVTSFQPQFLSPSLITKYIPRNIMLSKKLSTESGIHSKSQKKLRNTRSSEELPSSIEKLAEDSTNIKDNRKAEYAALERAAELEAEKMVKSTTQRT